MSKAKPEIVEDKLLYGKLPRAIKLLAEAKVIIEQATEEEAEYRDGWKQLSAQFSRDRFDAADQAVASLQDAANMIAHATRCTVSAALFQASRPTFKVDEEASD
jgi:hypothetical protein